METPRFPRERAKIFLSLSEGRMGTKPSYIVMSNALGAGASTFYSYGACGSHVWLYCFVSHFFHASVYKQCSACLECYRDVADEEEQDNLSGAFGSGRLYPVTLVLLKFEKKC